MATKLYFGGGESHKHWLRLYENGVRNMLVSFYHLQDRANDALVTRKNTNPDISIFADSGGFTFQTLMDKHKWTNDDLKKILDQYLEFLEFNKNVLDAAVEMDLEHIFGYGEIRRWQDKFFQPIEKAGLPIIYIWHKERGVGEWEEMCRRHRFVGVNELVFESMAQDQLMAIAKKYLTKVHGFGLSRQWVFQEMGLATADSVTWKAGERYGTLFTFLDNKLRRHKQAQLTKQETRFRKFVEDNGGDYDKILAGDYKEFAKMGIIAHVLMQQYCDKLHNVDYYMYRLPDPDQVLKLTKQEVSDWSDKFKHMWREDPPFNRFDLQVLSALQNGRWEFFDNETNKYAAHDSFVAVMGASCDISFTNIERRLELRQRACRRSLPETATGTAMPRVTSEDFKDQKAPKKRNEYAPVRFR